LPRGAWHVTLIGKRRHARHGGRGAGETRSMTRRRFWIYFLLFLFNVIAYTDRVNISVASKPIADELHLSPVALGYLFSSFLWAYVLMMLPAGG
jgi:sugar phosphate permease